MRRRLQLLLEGEQEREEEELLLQTETAAREHQALLPRTEEPGRAMTEILQLAVAPRTQQASSTLERVGQEQGEKIIQQKMGQLQQGESEDSLRMGQLAWGQQNLAQLQQLKAQMEGRQEKRLQTEQQERRE